MLTAERAREVISYNPETGHTVWIKPLNARIKPGARAGTLNGKGYRQIRIDGGIYTEHRLAFLLIEGVWPESEVDHVNGVRDDNRWENIRKATVHQNRQNTGPFVTNTSGVKGVCWDTSRRKWLAQIGINGKSKSLGRYVDMEEAIRVRKQAEELYYGAYAGRQTETQG